jgi:peptidoglycan/xylan/chitin deacetylase (PgdA/CDA1 family)
MIRKPVIRHALASIHAPTAQALGLPRTLPELHEQLASSGIAAVQLDSSNNVALTFDDGPHPEGTPQILEVLAQHGAKAAFFVVGEQVRKRPELVRRAVAEGHLIALHADEHRLHSKRTSKQLTTDYERGAAAIEDAIGQPPLLHRPPFGIYSPVGLRIARARGLQPLLWADWGRDWRKYTTPERIAARVTRNLAPGDVVLLHDADFYSAKRSHERTAVALKLILNKLDAGRVGTVLPV